VAFIDADRKPTSEEWYKLRLDTTKPRMTFRRVSGDIEDTIFSLAKSHDFLVIDTGGMDGREMRYTLGYAHKFICPTQPSGFDLNVLQGVQDYVQLARPLNPTIEAFTLLNRASNNKRSLSNKHAWETLRSEELSKMKVIPDPIHDLEAWRRCSTTGFGVCEMDCEKSNRDLKKLIKNIGL